MMPPTEKGTALDGTPHYSTNPKDPIYFFGGWASSFAGWPVYMLCPLFLRGVAIPEPLATTPFRYESVEHYFHCCKAHTWKEHERVRKAENQWRAKDMGRSIPMTAHEVKTWDAMDAYGAMLRGHRAKYFQHPQFARYLMQTGDRLIAEDSKTDFIWGIRDEAGGMTGKNQLGKVLMQVRAELREVAKWTRT